LIRDAGYGQISALVVGKVDCSEAWKTKGTEMKATTKGDTTRPWIEKSKKVDKEQRRAMGRLLKGLRERAGMTQNELAKAVGQEYFTFISQVEGGAAKIPAKDIGIWAKALGVNTQDLAKEALRYYDPDIFDALFTKQEQRERGL
jgi:ribosome-binding protein aMBF1 (putative translation factor)